MILNFNNYFWKVELLIGISVCGWLGLNFAQVSGALVGGQVNDVHGAAFERFVFQAEPRQDFLGQREDALPGGTRRFLP